MAKVLCGLVGIILLFSSCLAEESNACTGHVSVKKSWWQQDSYCVLFRVKVDGCSRKHTTVEGSYSFHLVAELDSGESWDSWKITDSFSNPDYSAPLRSFLRESCFMFHGQGTPERARIKRVTSRSESVGTCHCNTTTEVEGGSD